MPADVKLEVIRDQSRYISAALHEIESHLVLGSILASLVVLAFMRSWRSTLIAAVATPVAYSLFDDLRSTRAWHKIAAPVRLASRRLRAAIAARRSRAKLKAEEAAERDEVLEEVKESQAKVGAESGD